MGESCTGLRLGDHAPTRQNGEARREVLMDEPSGDNDETASEPEDAMTDLLVEEVSIDGLCGVY
jgi:mycofactocin precursor